MVVVGVLHFTLSNKNLKKKKRNRKFENLEKNNEKKIMKVENKMGVLPRSDLSADFSRRCRSGFRVRGSAVGFVPPDTPLFLSVSFSFLPKRVRDGMGRGVCLSVECRVRVRGIISEMSEREEGLGRRGE